MEKLQKKKGVTPQALLDRPLVSDQIMPYYKGWNILDPRRQFSESGAQALPMTDIITVANLMIGEDKDDVYDFCVIMSTVESETLKELAAKRKREMERIKAKGPRK